MSKKNQPNRLTLRKFRSRIPLLLSYVENIKRILRREAIVSYGREEFYRRFWTSATNEIGAEIESLGSNIYIISKSGRYTFVQLQCLCADTYFNRMLVDYKPIICNLLSQQGYLTPKHIEYNIRSVNKAWGFMREQGGSFVVKPRIGGGGEGITTGINNYKRLKKASIRAAAFVSSQLMLEEQIPGESYRLLFLNGELLDVVKRCRPSVVGDGRLTIRELIDEENNTRRQHIGERSLFELKADLDCEFYLEERSLYLSSVPKSGDRVVIKNVVNENSIDENFTELERTHAKFREIGMQISDFLGANLIGIDVITSDISRSPDQESCMITEINIPPGLHYHVMVANPEAAVPIGPKILEFLLSDAGIPTSLPLIHRQLLSLK